MAKSDDYSPERLADRAEIQDAMYRWCRAIDRLDYDSIRTVFHPDAIDSHGPYEGGIDGLIDWIRGRHDTIQFSMHSISNILIEFAGPDSAIVETYCFAVQRYRAKGKASLDQFTGGEYKAGTAMDLIVCARYVDRFERRAGEWRILHRRVVYDSKMTHEVPEALSKVVPNWTYGQRNKTDYIYRARTVVGLH
jgi:hypothetical protein